MAQPRSKKTAGKTRASRSAVASGEGPASADEVAVAEEVIDVPAREGPAEGAAREEGAPAGDGAAGAEVLAEVTPATDAELDVIARDSLHDGARPAPAGTAALALRDPLAAYMAEARRYPLLSREEEQELARRWVEDGDMEAAKRLMTSNLRLVVKIAHEYRRAYQNLLDLIQEGNVGLVKAVHKFDPYKGVRLSTYAAWWIKAYILKYILNNWRLVKLGTTQNQRKLFFNLRKQKAALEAAGIDPTPERIAKALDVSPKEVVEMDRRMSGPDVSLDAKVRDDGDESGRTRLDMLEDEYADPSEAVGDQEFRELLAEKLREFGSTLEGRELEIFQERLLAQDHPITLQALGDRWGVSRERARQVEKRMLTRLRAYLQQELGEAVQISLGHH